MLERGNDAFEGFVVENEPGRDEGFVGKFSARLHKIKQSLFNYVVLLEPMTFGEAIEPLFCGGRNRSGDLRFIAHVASIVHGKTCLTVEKLARCL